MQRHELSTTEELGRKGGKERKGRKGRKERDEAVTSASMK